MEVAPVKNRNNFWSKSVSGKEPPLETTLEQQNGIGLESALATQLQQAWLQTQLPKRNVPRTDFLSPLPSPDYQFRGSLDPIQQQFQHQLQLLQPQPQPQPYASLSSRSSSFSLQSPSSTLSQASPRYSSEGLPEIFSSSDGESAVVSGGPDEGRRVELEPLEEDMMLQYISDMLMDEEMADQKCMYVQCSAYHAMTKELADLIGDGSPTDANVHNDAYDAPNSQYEDAERDTAVNNWIDDVLSSQPRDFFHGEEMRESRGSFGVDLADEVSTIATGITNITTDSPHSRFIVPGSQEATPAAALLYPKYSDPDCPFLEMRPDSLAVDDMDDRSGTEPTDSDCPYLEERPDSLAVDYIAGRSGIESLVDLYPLLMQCAQAVGTDNVGEAHQIISHLRRKTSPFGDGGQRLAYYVVEALVARLSGTGARLYTALSGSRPSALEMLRAHRLYALCNPLPKISHFMANVNIFKAVRGSNRIHIIDYGILYGVQWPCFLKKLSMLDGGPPHVRITGIDFAQPGFHKNVRVEETGRRLQAKAKELGVELEFHAIAGKWENITAAQLQLRDDETLVVNCMYRLRNLLDETVMASSPRKMLLSKIRSLNPKVFIMGVINAGINSPFFMGRFRETINHFSVLFDAIHTTMPPNNHLRRLIEKEVLGREILNIVACEGTERIERAETYKQWQSRSINAGFRQLPQDPAVTARANELLQTFNPNYGIVTDGNWHLNGWKGHWLHAVTSWTCA